MQEKLDILIGALASIGITTNAQMLEVIFELERLVDEKGEELSLKEVRQVAREITQKYA